MLAAVGKLPGVHLGVAMLLTGNESEGNALILQALMAERGDYYLGDYYLGDYGSEIRDQAMVINILISTDAVNKELQQQALNMLPKLADLIQQKQWLSTQERSAILALAMTIEQQYQQQAWQGRLTIADEQSVLQKTGEYRQNIAPLAQVKRSFINSGTIPLYVSFDWMGVKKQAEYDLNNGIEVNTEHFVVANNIAKPVNNLNAVNSGDVLLTRISHA